LVLLIIANKRAFRIKITNPGEQFFVNKLLSQFPVESVGVTVANLFAFVTEHVEEGLENTREFDHIKLGQLNQIVLELLRGARVVLGINNGGVVVRGLSAAQLSVGAGLVTFKLLAVGDHALRVHETLAKNLPAGVFETI
jgi:hypothetical protein